MLRMVCKTLKLSLRETRDGVGLTYVSFCPSVTKTGAGRLDFISQRVKTLESRLQERGLNEVTFGHVQQGGHLSCYGTDVIQLSNHFGFPLTNDSLSQFIHCYYLHRVTPTFWQTNMPLFAHFMILSLIVYDVFSTLAFFVFMFYYDML